MYTTSDLKKGLKVELDGVPFTIVDLHFQKPGKGQAVYTCKLKNLLTGNVLTKTYRSGASIEEAGLEERTLVYSYADGPQHVFMDENYEQVEIGRERLGDAVRFLAEDMEVTFLYHRGKIIEVNLPNFVEKRVVATEPGARGNTATNVLKPATVEGGHVAQVALFINEGDIVKIDTRTGEYVERVRKA